VSWRAFGVPKDIGKFFAELVAQRRESIQRSVADICSLSTRLVEIGTKDLDTVQNVLLREVRHSVLHAQRRLSSSAGTIRADVMSSLRSSEAYLAGHLKAIAGLWPPILLRHKSVLFRDLSGVSALAKRALSSSHDRLSGLLQQFLSGAEIYLRHVSSRVDSLERIAEEASPKVQLRRGYVLISQEGKIVTRKDGFKSAEEGQVEFYDGTLRIKAVDNCSRG
jgi:exonuclease VII large subunit